MSSEGLSALEKNAMICSQNAMQPIQLCVVTATIKIKANESFKNGAFFNTEAK